MKEKKSAVYVSGKYLRIIIILFVVEILFSVFFIWETAEIRQYAGIYTSVDAEDSLYELTLSKTGRISVADIGAGNPALEGYIYRTPKTAKEGFYCVKTGGETDGVYLDLESNGGKAKAWLFEVGKEYGAIISKEIILETDTGHMQFEKE